MRRRHLPLTVLFALPVLAAANDAELPTAPKPTFNLRDPAVREVVRKAVESARDVASKRVDDREIPASDAALKMAPFFVRAQAPANPQQSTCTPVVAAGGKGTEMQHIGIASDPLQSWVATQASYTTGSVGGGAWPCTTRDAGLPSPWTK